MNQLLVSLRGRVMAALFAIFLLPLAAWAQSGSIAGTVVDATSGEPLEGATVAVADGRQIGTDRFGRFNVPLLEPGSYTLRVNYVGYDMATESVAVSAGETSTVRVALTSDIIVLEDLVVSGQAAGQAAAISQQRAADTITNIVASDAFGRFPDQNAAEALGRLPGVTIERDQGEGRYVSIRGISQELVGVAVDGISIASPKADERAILLDIVPSDTLERLEVYKAVRPDMPAEATGGFVNLRTPSAFDADGRILRVLGQANYSELTDDFGYRLNATYGDQFGPDKQHGVLFAISYDERDMASDNVEADPWELEEDPTSGAENWFSSELQFREYNLERERFGLVANYEFRPNSETLVFVRANYSEYMDHEYRNRFVVIMDAEDEEGEDLSEIVSLTADGAVVANTFVENQLKDRIEELSIVSISTGGEFVMDAWTFDGALAWSFADEDTPDDYEVTYLSNDEEEADTELTWMGWDTYNPRFTVTGGTDVLDPANFFYDGLEDADQLVEEEEWLLKANARLDLDTANPMYVKGGFWARFKEKTNDVEVFEADDNPGSIETLGNLGEEFDYPFDDHGTPIPFVSHRFSNLFFDQRGDFALEQNVFDSAVEDYESSEDVIAAYVMGGVSIDKHELVYGVRIENTQFESDGFRVSEEEDENGDDVIIIETQSADNDYTDVLPGVLYTYRLSDAMIIRAAWTNTVNRPNFEQTRISEEVDGEDIVIGNPELDPYRAMNFDVSFEYYLESLGVISASAFYKDVDDFIYEVVVAEGSRLGGDLETFRNGDSADIYGLELAYQQRFTFLPGALDGFGVYANLTLSDSDARLLSNDGEDPRDSQLPKHSEVTGNFALTYEKYGFFARIAATYRSEYLDELGPVAEEDRYVDNYIQWDVSTSYSVTPNVSIFANFINVGNEPFRAYFDESDRLSQFEEYSWSAQIGAKWSY